MEQQQAMEHIAFQPDVNTQEGAAIFYNLTSKAQQTPCCVYDFTLKDIPELNPEIICEKLTKIAKKWTFQKENGKSDYLHYQGRISLKMKCRVKQCQLLLMKEFGNNVYATLTSAENHKNDFYVTKDDTRIEGPWSDLTYKPAVEKPAYLNGIDSWKPWQLQIIAMVDEHIKNLNAKGTPVLDKRTINWLYDPIGSQGKSAVTIHLCWQGKALQVPFCNNYQDLMAMVIDRPIAPCYIFDFPRAINKSKIADIFSALETIKNGYAYDRRYSFREKYFAPPKVFVMSNTLPDLESVSTDRWKIWTINESDDSLEELLIAPPKRVRPIMPMPKVSLMLQPPRGFQHQT